MHNAVAVQKRERLERLEQKRTQQFVGARTAGEHREYKETQEGIVNQQYFRLGRHEKITLARLRPTHMSSRRVCNEAE